MCRRTTCRICGKPDWTGCGAHVEHVMSGVAVADRCQRDHTRSDSGGGGRFRRLFRR